MSQFKFGKIHKQAASYGSLAWIAMPYGWPGKNANISYTVEN